MKLFITFAILAFLSVVVSAAGMPDTVVVKKSNDFITDADKNIKPTANKMAAASMSHKKHAAANLKCDQCHHVKGNPEKQPVCAKCHKGETGAKTVMNNSCMKCHKETKKGPMKCKECHTVALAKK
ncbi:MAG: cytochrome c3 family protein [Fibrobacteres bacterium]|nr:cytochrome c3 family protein [Fibrobacterota bacterium]